jgi:hypothetical protein
MDRRPSCSWQVWAGRGDELYNPSANAWTTFDSPPCNCRGGASLLITGNVLVAGGVKFVNASPYPIEETIGSAALWNPSTLAWTSTGSLHGSRTSESMTALANGEVLVAGGMKFEKSAGALVPMATVELYKP